MNALLKMAGAAVLLAGISVPAVALAQSTVTAPGGNTSGTYMDYMKTVYDRAGAPEITSLPLTEFDGDFKLNPMGAASWTQSADGLTWTFKLQPNLVWSDGVPLTAEDYVFALQRAAKEGYDFNWYWAFAGGIKGWGDVTGDKHADPSTISFTVATSSNKQLPGSEEFIDQLLHHMAVFLHTRDLAGHEIVALIRIELESSVWIIPRAEVEHFAAYVLSPSARCMWEERKSS